MVLMVGLVAPLSMGMRQCEDIPKADDSALTGQSAAPSSAKRSEGSGPAARAADSGAADHASSANQSGGANQSSSAGQNASSGWVGGAAGGGSAGQGGAAAGSGEDARRSAAAGSASPGSSAAADGGGVEQGSAVGHDGASGSGSSAGHAGADAQSGAAGRSEPERCGIDSPVKCAARDYCKSAPDINCGPKTIGGVCELKNNACADIGHNMCGCDNRTYGNECEAQEAGIALRSEGACSIDDCKAAGGRHVKLDAPTTMGDCDESDESWPVGRGLDAEYNFCCRAKRAPGKKCGGRSGVKCENGEFCRFDSNNDKAGCDVATAGAPGICEPIPQRWCSRDLRPVCGCDGRTYNNACEAHMAATSVKHQAVCTARD